MNKQKEAQLAEYLEHADSISSDASVFRWSEAKMPAPLRGAPSREPHSSSGKRRSTKPLWRLRPQEKKVSRSFRQLMAFQPANAAVLGGILRVSTMIPDRAH